MNGIGSSGKKQLSWNESGSSQLSAKRPQIKNKYLLKKVPFSFSFDISVVVIDRIGHPSIMEYAMTLHATIDTQSRTQVAPPLHSNHGSRILEAQIGPHDNKRLVYFRLFLL